MRSAMARRMGARGCVTGDWVRLGLRRPLVLDPHDFGVTAKARQATSDFPRSITDPTAIERCDPTAGTGAAPRSVQATRQQATIHLITHELGHAVGITTHTSDPADLMYQYTNDWRRDGRFSPGAAGYIKINNGGVQ
jgi:hypothetical protein